MNEKILLIDFMNAVWRSSILFGFKSSHTECRSCDEFAFEHSTIGSHCEYCKSPWDLLEDKCPNDSTENIIAFNFFRNLRPLIEMFSPQKIFVVMEGHPIARHNLLSTYKANRIVKTANAKSAKNYDDVMKAAEIIKDVLINFPVTLIKANDYECDDVISSLCEDMKEEDITILSNDSDYIQLLQKGYNKIKIYNPIKKVFMTAPEYPYVAWKSINGDKSDNIDGLVSKNKALEIMADPKKFKQFLSVQENSENFFINKQLIEFMKVPPEDLIITECFKDFSIVKKKFEALMFSSITKEPSWTKYVSTFNCVSAY